MARGPRDHHFPPSSPRPCTPAWALAPPSGLWPRAELVWELSYRVWTTPAVSTCRHTHQQCFQMALSPRPPCQSLNLPCARHPFLLLFLPHSLQLAIAPAAPLQCPLTLFRPSSLSKKYRTESLSHWLSPSFSSTCHLLAQVAAPCPH